MPVDPRHYSPADAEAPAWEPPAGAPVGVGQGWSEDDYDVPLWGAARRFGDFISGRRADETDEERQRREALEDATRAQQLASQGLPPDRGPCAALAPAQGALLQTVCCS